jgi:serine/threonine protein kinase
MAIQLEVIDGPDRGRTFPLDFGATVIVGRGRSARVRLNDVQVSREQCRIESTAEGLVLTDAGSTGGTFVNGQRVTKQVLRLGDVVVVGQTHLRIAESDLADRMTVPPVPPAPRGPTPAPAALPVDPAEASSAAPVAAFAALPPDRLAELEGQTFWHYLLGEPLARGQSGLVFRGTDERDGQEVAIKVLWPHLAQHDEEVQRIFRAARTMYTLRHPHVVTLRQAGKTGAYLWFAMDFVDGESLTQVIDRIGVAGMLDWRYAFRVALDIGDALKFAHAHHVVHRNITPQNVILRTADKCALLGDLALAKALEGSQAQQITRPGELLGDVRYMSPERLAGVEPIDERSDIYSLGAMLYALLTGRPPFAGATIIETIALVRTAAPVPPKKYQMAVSDQFEGVVLKMLGKRPEERYQSAAELLAQLERVAKFQGIKV